MERAAEMDAGGQERGMDLYSESGKLDGSFKSQEGTSQGSTGMYNDWSSGKW